MNAKHIVSALLATATFFAAADANAACATPTRLEIDEVSFPSWTYLIGGEWTALPQNGISHGYCYKQESGMNDDPQVLFNYNNMWYLAIAPDCNNIGVNTWLAAFYGGSASNPTAPEFVRSIRSMRIEVAADDAYYVSLDGEQQSISFGGQTVSEVTEYGWTKVGVVERDVVGDMHTVEVHASDEFGTVAGMAAHITVDGGSCGDLLTGRDAFEFGNVIEEGNVNPTPGLSGIAFEAPHAYHNVPGTLGSAGAKYVWWSPNATVLGEADFSVDILVP